MVEESVVLDMNSGFSFACIEFSEHTLAGSTASETTLFQRMDALLIIYLILLT